MISLVAPRVDQDLVAWYARRYVISNMTSWVRIARRDRIEVAHDGQGVAIPIYLSLLYEGVARVYPASGPQNVDSTEESQVFASSYVSTPMKDLNGELLLTQVNDVIEVVRTSDPLLVGRYFRVIDVDAGGQWAHVRRHMVTGAERYEGWTWREHGNVGIPRGGTGQSALPGPDIKVQ